MKASELRILNTIKAYLAPPISEWIEHTVTVKTLQRIQKNTNHGFRPIPLTEEWLLKFGFMSDNLLDEDRTPLLAIGCGEHVIYFTVGYYRECEIYGLKISCEYVHQLQNLYHALTGQELKTKK